MAKRIREVPANPLDPDYWQNRTGQGWRLAAVEWEQPDQPAPGPEPFQEEIPYGLRIGSDCCHLEEDPREREALVIMMESIVQDRKLSDAAAELNRRGFRTRSGALWSPAAVFSMLPRLIEVGPRIFSESDWSKRRRSLARVL